MCLAVAGARLYAGLQLGQQVRDVLGLVQLLGLFLGGKRFAAFEFRLDQLVQLLLVSRRGSGLG